MSTLREAFLYGNLHLVEFTAADLAALIATEPITHRTMVAYEYFCRNFVSSKHYHGNKHLLFYYPELIPIARKYLTNWEVKVCKYTRHSPKINMLEVPTFIPQFTDLAPFLLQDKSIECHRDNLHNIASDNYQWVYPSDTVLAEIANRLSVLEMDAPQYAKLLASKYLNLVKVAKRNNVYDHQWNCLHRFYPQLFNDINHLSSLARRIAKFSPIVQAYYLGLPIVNISYSREILGIWLEKLSSMGPEAYLQQEEIRKFLPWKQLGIIPENEQNFFYESIDQFSPFDLIMTSQGSRYYVFTRSEFQTLSRAKINHWNTLQLDIYISEIVTMHQKYATIHSLPDSQPLREAYNTLLSIDNIIATPVYVPTLKELPTYQPNKRRRLSSTPKPTINSLPPGAIPNT